MKATAYKAIIVWGIIYFTIGCKGYLDEIPYSFLAPENFFASEQDAELALTGVYNILNAGSIQGTSGNNHRMWGRGMHYMTGLGNDELVAVNTFADVDYIALSNYTYNSENTVLSFTWMFLYAGIVRANYIVEKVGAIEMDPERRDDIIGEARFLRGMFYFYLGTLFGGAPINLGTDDFTNSPRNSLREVLEVCEQDLLYAYNTLPHRNIRVGRINKYTAAGFLAKLYLYLGSCKEYQVGASLNDPLNSFDWVNQNEMYTKVSQYCRDVVDNGGYVLIDIYRDLFSVETEEEGRKEHMMIVQNGAGGSNANVILLSLLAGPQGNAQNNGGTNGRVKPVKELYDKYHMDDPRLAHNVVGPIGAQTTDFSIINGVRYYTPAAVNTANFNNLQSGKYREPDPQIKISKGLTAGSAEIDFGILRYADVLLMYAESAYKLGDEGLSRQLVEDIRRRACQDDETKLETLTAAYYKTDFMEEVLDERSRELCVEGWRRHDLIRTNKLEEVVSMLQVSGAGSNNSQMVPDVKANFAYYKIWYPIPQREINLNPNLVQNPQYAR